MLKNKILIKLSIITSLILVIAGCGGGGSGGSGGGGSTTTTNTTIATGSVILSWDAPTTNSDGSQLGDLAGYKVYYGNSSGNYTDSVDVGNIAGASVSTLTSGTWCFSVTAYDTSGNESDYSGEQCTSI
jgi:uncharacterized protein YfaP (DUF2135 family)